MMWHVSMSASRSATCTLYKLYAIRVCTVYVTHIRVCTVYVTHIRVCTVYVTQIRVCTVYVTHIRVCDGVGLQLG